MKIYKLPLLAEGNPESEYRLGPENLRTGTAYLVYGKMRPKEAARKFTCPEGREEIVYVVKGTIRVKYGKSTFSVASGEAFSTKEADTLYLDNLCDEEAVYIAAGAQAIKSAGVKPGRVEEKETAVASGAEPEADEVEEEDEFVITSDGPDAEDDEAGS